MSGTSATIDAARDTFTLINTFEVDAGQQQPLIDELARVTRELTRHLPGFVGTSVHRGRDGIHVVNYAQWASRAAFDAMRADPRMAAHFAAVAALARTITPQFYEVAYVAAGGEAGPRAEG